jgi:anti-sigma factor RsiW
MTGNDSPIGEDDLQAFLDDRLDGARLRKVEAYLADHPEIEERVKADRRVREKLRAQLERKFAEPVPARLRVATVVATRRARRVKLARSAVATLGLVAAGAAAGWIAARADEPGLSVAAKTVAPTALVTMRADAAYRTFVVEIAHPVEVDASPDTHLMQWLSKRLRRPLVAPDLSSFGYRLMGGRLLPAGDTAAAQLMYDDATGKRLTVYLQASPGAQTAFRFGRDGDASTFAWLDRGFGFAVTAVEKRDRLLPIAEAVYLSLMPGRVAPAKQDG